MDSCEIGSIWRTDFFFPQHIHEKLKAENSGEKAAVDQKLQITHQNPRNLPENTNLKIKVEGTQTQTYLSGKEVFEFTLAGCQILNHPSNSIWN